MHKNLFSMLIAALLSAALCVHACAEEKPTVSVAPSFVLNIIGEETKEICSFTLEAKDEANPMPDGSENGKKVMAISEPGKYNFGNISFLTIGEYSYLVSQEKGTDKNTTYDDSIYTITVYVSWENDVGMDMNAVVVYKEEGKDGKAEEIYFENTNSGVITTPTPSPTATPTPEPTKTPEPSGQKQTPQPSPVYTEVPLQTPAPTTAPYIPAFIPQTGDTFSMNVITVMAASGIFAGLLLIKKSKARKGD